MPADSESLGEIATRLTMLDVSCHQCDRRERLSVARLVERYSGDLPAPALRRIVSADCPRLTDGEMRVPCGVRFPNLSAGRETVPRGGARQASPGPLEGASARLARPEHPRPDKVRLRTALSTRLIPAGLGLIYLVLTIAWCFALVEMAAWASSGIPMLAHSIVEHARSFHHAADSGYHQLGA
jgi:hypothetical protein